MVRPNHDRHDRESELIRAKDDFRTTMLANDSFFAAVTARLDLGTQVDRAELPDFGCEPTLEFKDGEKIIGVRLSSARSESSGAWSIGFAVFDYMRIASIDNSTNEGSADSAFVDLLRIAGTEDPDGAVREIGNDWATGYNAIFREFRDELGVDPMTHTLELKSRLDRTSYMIEE